MRLVRLRIRTAAQYVAIGIFDLHLQRPRVVRRRMSDLDSPGLTLLVQLLGVAYPNPRPGAKMALVSLADEDRAAISGNRREPRTLEVDLEPKLVGVEIQAALKEFHAQYRDGVAE